MPATTELTLKEVCYEFHRSRWTVQRWKKRGAPFHGRCIQRHRLRAWLRMEETARHLKLAHREFLALPPSERASVLSPLRGCQKEIEQLRCALRKNKALHAEIRGLKKDVKKARAA